MNPKETNYFKLLAKKFSGELTPEESALLQQWIDKDVENKEVSDYAEKVWKLSGAKLSLNNPDTESEWQQLKLTLEKTNHHNAPTQSWGNKVSFFWKVAAFIIFTVGLIYLLFRQGNDKTTTEHLAVFQTTDSASLFYLPDSSRVWLNANSAIQFSPSFERRFVKLTGEGFFDVKHDTTHVFSVASGNTMSYVIGTSFNLKAHEQDSTVELTVVTGKVKVVGEGGEEVLLDPGDRSVYFKNEQRLVKEHSTDTKFTKWVREDILPLRDEKKNPTAFLTHTFNWKKNRLNQTVIEGTITNHAQLTSYSSIQIRVSRITGAGRTVEQDIVLFGFTEVSPGATVPFKVPLMDVFGRQKEITLEITGAKPSE